MTKQQRAELIETLCSAHERLDGYNPGHEFLCDSIVDTLALLRSEPKIQARWVDKDSDHSIWSLWHIYPIMDGMRYRVSGHGFDICSPSYASKEEAKTACLQHAERLLAQLTEEGEA